MWSKEDALLDSAAEIIRSGGVVIVPTETFYGLAADPFQEQAVRRVFQIKQRDESKPLPLIASDRSVVEDLIEPPDARVQELMARFWPGSLTILLRPKRTLSPLLTSPDGLIGVRLPPTCPARSLAARVGGFITATSANLTGDPDPSDVSTISPRVLDAVDLVIDLGPTPGGKPSTVVEPAAAELRIIRDGAIPGSLLADFFRSCLRNRAEQDSP
ncbi:MAG: L-threonylcarbamoyladenylate synthase [Thermodesulfobacteriota bacterium]